MPSYSFEKFHGVIVRAHHVPGNVRASGNFDLGEIKILDYLCLQCPRGIVFDVMQNASFSSDRVVLSDVNSGSVRRIPGEYGTNKLYIANVRFLDEKPQYEFEFDVRIKEYS